MSLEPAPTQSAIPAKRDAAAMADGDKSAAKPVKRRASKACQSCRARKVRCNVVEQSPCTNCRLDQVACVVSESKRKRKSRPDALPSAASLSDPSAHAAPSTFPLAAQHAPFPARHPSDAHVPHPLYRIHGDRSIAIDPALQSASPDSSSNTRISIASAPNDPLPPFFSNSDYGAFRSQLPGYIKPLPDSLGADELDFLQRKSALDIPNATLRSAVFRCYVEFVHPFMPVLDLVDFFSAVDREDGSNGRVSLFLFQAVMFAGIAFCDLSVLRKAGFHSRREARKRFYQKARILYDLDTESDRMTLVQGILMLTFWYEMPNDLKDTWHWMGLAASFAQTLGLNRDPARSSMSTKRQRQWKRVWWSCVMRDRLIALGMRRPTRIKAEDSDVPMLTLDDFEILALPVDLSCISHVCLLARDVEMQSSLARACIEKAKLCVCVSHVLAAQYSVPEPGSLSDEGTTKTVAALLPKKMDPERSEVKACHRELQHFYETLPHDTQWHAIDDAGLSPEQAPLIVNRALLHMIYFTTLSALHRPQVFAEATALPAPASSSDFEALEISKTQIRLAATGITEIARDLHRMDWIRYLPTTGVTVLQPAIITHLLDIKASSEELRTSGLRGFCQCIQVMGRLCEGYAAADYSMALIEAAVRKADIQILNKTRNASTQAPTGQWRKAGCTNDLVDAGVQQNLIQPFRRPLTPPPDSSSGDSPGMVDPSRYEDDVAGKLETFLASTPPNSEPSSAVPAPDRPHDGYTGALDFDFDALVNMDELGENLGAHGLASMQGESSGFTLDMDWLTTVKDYDIFGSGYHSVAGDDAARGDADADAPDPEHPMAAGATAMDIDAST